MKTTWLTRSALFLAGTALAATPLLAQRPNLKTTAVGKNWFVPIHEGVQSA